MNLPYFIARKIISDRSGKSSISRPIIKIAVAAIAIGMVMMIISVATGVGLQKKIRQKVSAFNGHIVISNFDDNRSQVSLMPISTNQKFYPKFKDVESISHVQAVASKAGIIRTENAFEGIILKGVGKDYLWDNLREYLVEGNLPDFSGKLNDHVLISRYLANRLNLKIGSRFNTFFMKERGNQLPNLRVFTVAGIYSSGFQEFDGAYIIGDIRHVQRINKWKSDEVGSFEVFVENFDEIGEKGKEIYTQTSSTLDTQTIVDKYFYIFEWLQLFDFNIIVILIIMILVATINMAVALLVLVLERTQMIGILKSLGATNWIVRKIFLHSALFLILRGLFWGNFIGISLLLLQKLFGIIKLNPENYYVNEAPVDINLWYILLLNIGTVVVCLIVLVVPSYIITKISPIKAIRFQ